jgi:hypothetical protein
MLMMPSYTAAVCMREKWGVFQLDLVACRPSRNRVRAGKSLVMTAPHMLLSFSYI